MTGAGHEFQIGDCKPRPALRPRESPLQPSGRPGPPRRKLQSGLEGRYRAAHQPPRGAVASANRPTASPESPPRPASGVPAHGVIGGARQDRKQPPLHFSATRAARFAWQLGQKLRVWQEKASRCSSRHWGQRISANPLCSRPHSQEGRHRPRHHRAQVLVWKYRQITVPDGRPGRGQPTTVLERGRLRQSAFCVRSEDLIRRGSGRCGWIRRPGRASALVAEGVASRDWHRVSGAIPGRGCPPTAGFRDGLARRSRGRNDRRHACPDRSDHRLVVDIAQFAGGEATPRADASPSPCHRGHGPPRASLVQLRRQSRECRAGGFQDEPGWPATHPIDMSH